VLGSHLGWNSDPGSLPFHRTTYKTRRELGPRLSQMAIIQKRLMIIEALSCSSDLDPRQCEASRVRRTPLLSRQLLAEALWVRFD
jgi:hypothetical protein